MKSPYVLALILVFVCSLCVGPAAAIAGDNDWRPVDPADLSLKTSTVEKDADAEALLWEVRLLDELEGSSPRTVLKHYVRIKIFTEHGKASQSKVDIPYLNGWKITDISARTITPDNKIIELKKEDIFERSIVKSSGTKVKAKSFAMPGVVPGAIIEYRWREVRNDQIAYYMRLPFQRDVPVRLVKHYVKPLMLAGFPYGMRAQTFHGKNTPFVNA